MATAATEFDFVIVGGGSAGCAVAARLSEDPSARVALIEAGPLDRGRLFEIPGLYSQLQKTTYDWDFQTEPEPELHNRRAYLPRGRVLGGTSSINTMVYIRGGAWDYDRWEQLGCTGWSYADVLPYFCRAEDNERGASAFHGVGGPLAVSDARSVHPLIEAWVAAAVEAGHPANDDFNGATQDGVGVYQMTQRNGLRASASRAYLGPAITRPNLAVFTSSHVLRIVIEGGTAVGVQFDRQGECHALAATSEVVLCAGAYQSPQLLMLSGIGPAAHLDTFGITSIVDLPQVGENLQDHPGCFLSFPSRIPDLSHSDTPQNEVLLRETGHGPLTWTEAGGFIRTRADLPVPDLQFHVAPGMFRDEGLSPAFDHAISFGPYVNRPASRGRVSLRSAVPYAKPRIFHNYLAEAADRANLREGVRIALNIASQSPLRAHLKGADDAVAAGLLPPSDSDEALDAFVRQNAFSFYHPCGTCAIGSVVDSHLRVLGIDRLRIADTSIMPTLPGGNTNAPAIMIGERAADFIKRDYGALAGS